MVLRELQGQTGLDQIGRRDRAGVTDLEETELAGEDGHHHPHLHPHPLHLLPLPAVFLHYPPSAASILTRAAVFVNVYEGWEGSFEI